MSSFDMFGPYFFYGNCTAELYFHMLQNYLVHGLEATYENKLTNGTLYFQHDGAPSHYATAVRTYLNATFKAGVIGRCGSIDWPPRSSDLTPLDFFLWGYMKDKVYARKPQTLDQLRGFIEDAFTDLEVMPTMLKKVIDSIPGRLQDCIYVGGETFEY